MARWYGCTHVHTTLLHTAVLFRTIKCIMSTLWYYFMLLYSTVLCLPNYRKLNKQAVDAGVHGRGGTYGTRGGVSAWEPKCGTPVAGRWTDAMCCAAPFCAVLCCAESIYVCVCIRVVCR